MPEGELHQPGVADDVLVSLGQNLVASVKTFVYSDAEAHVVDSVEDAVVVGPMEGAVGPPVAVVAVGRGSHHSSGGGK